MAKHKKYKIDTFAKLCNLVNPENVENLAIDLAQWLMFYSKTIEDYRKTHPEATQGKSNNEIIESCFYWIDDKKNDIIGVELQSKQTGEVSNIKFNPPLTTEGQ